MGDRVKIKSYVRSLLVIILVLTGAQVIHALTGGTFELRKVFEFKPSSWKEWPLAVLDPEGDTIYLLQGSEVQAIDWKSGRTVASTSYRNLRCASAVKLGGWHFVPGRSEILAAYCGSLYLIDRDTLKVKKQLVGELASGGLAISPDGQWVAVSISRGSKAEFRYYVYLFDTANWDIAQRWFVDADGLSFSSDGKLLAIGRSRANEKKWVVSCGVEVYQVPSGQLYAEWWRDKKDICFRDPVFVVGNPDSLVTLGSSTEELIMWDVKDRTIRMRLKSQRPISGFLVSPDGSWLIANVSNDPEDTPEYNQDFVVWDLSSGAVLYDSPKIKWSPFAKLIDLWSRAALQLNSLSRDGKYLLVTKYKQLILYEIVFQVESGEGEASRF